MEASDGDAEFAALPENHSFAIPDGAHWCDVREATENIGKAIVGAFRAIETANGSKLRGIFGDAAWTNKKRLPDRLLKDLIEHFSAITLSIANCPEDELGQGYEYLIKKFADDSGHTAQEFYTNRTVVHLMTEILQPRPGESIYDPTCGSAGMLISSIAHLKQHGEEWRNVHAYGQEINQLSSAIGRMNLFLHGVEDFEIANDDTLRHPAFLEAESCAPSIWYSLTLPTRSNNGTARRSRRTPTAATSSAPRRRDEQTTPSYSTSSRVWTHTQAGAPFSSPWRTLPQRGIGDARKAREKRSR